MKKRKIFTGYSILKANGSLASGSDLGGDLEETLGETPIIWETKHHIHYDLTYNDKIVKVYLSIKETDLDKSD